MFLTIRPTQVLFTLSILPLELVLTLLMLSMSYFVGVLFFVPVMHIMPIIIENQPCRVVGSMRMGHYYEPHLGSIPKRSGKFVPLEPTHLFVFNARF